MKKKKITHTKPPQAISAIFLPQKTESAHAVAMWNPTIVLTRSHEGSLRSSGAMRCIPRFYPPESSYLNLHLPSFPYPLHSFLLFSSFTTFLSLSPQTSQPVRTLFNPFRLCLETPSHSNYASHKPAFFRFLLLASCLLLLASFLFVLPLPHEPRAKTQFSLSLSLIPIPFLSLSPAPFAHRLRFPLLSLSSSFSKFHFSAFPLRFCLYSSFALQRDCIHLPVMCPHSLTLSFSLCLFVFLLSNSVQSSPFPSIPLHLTFSSRFSLFSLCLNSSALDLPSSLLLRTRSP